jgi:aspartyl protease family protein
MATGFMLRIIALPLTLACAALVSPFAAATDVALIGLMGGSAAVLAVGGGEPKTVKVGQKWSGVTVVSVDRSQSQAVVEIDGKPRVLKIGQHYRAAVAPSSRQSVTLAADTRGHFVAEGAINGNPVRFLVDTGASTIALPASDAVRLGIDYRKGRRGFSSTANGVVPIYVLTLDTVRLGSIELTGVEAAVIEQGLDIALLGMSFLNRVEMKRDGHVMTLTRRF